MVVAVKIDIKQQKIKKNKKKNWQLYLITFQSGIFY